MCPMTSETSMRGYMQAIVERNLLKYEAGSAVFCPSCGNIMDWKKTVVATIHGTPAPGKDEIVARKYVMCSQCYERHHTALHDGVAKAAGMAPEKNIRLEIVDGRDRKYR